MSRKRLRDYPPVPLFNELSAWEQWRLDEAERQKRDWANLEELLDKAFEQLREVQAWNRDEEIRIEAMKAYVRENPVRSSGHELQEQDSPGGETAEPEEEPGEYSLAVLTAVSFPEVGLTGDSCQDEIRILDLPTA